MILDESGGEMDGVLFNVGIADSLVGESVGVTGESGVGGVVER